MEIKGRIWAVALTLCLVSSIMLSQPLGAAPSGSLAAGWTCNGTPATIVGTSGSDTLMGTPGADVIVAREGDDTIHGLGGDDIVCAGKGNDVIYGGAGFDILYGAQGNDSLYAADGASAGERSDTKGARMFGGVGNDKIHGSNRWDRMQGGPGNDQLFGYEGRDWLRAGAGNDAVDGGPGIDDQHGGNGSDDINVTPGDIVRGGAGLDLCQITGGQPALLRSCGNNERETPPRGVVVTVCDRGAEYVDILNDTNKVVSLVGWELQDEGLDHFFPLDNLTLQPGQTIRVISGPNPIAGQGEVVGWVNHVWNNTGDTAYLIDDTDTERHHLVCT